MTTSLATPDVETPQKATQTAGDAATASEEAASQIVSFRLASEEYGVDIMRVQEIILMGEITRMPQVPDFICGLINLRGNVIPIVDLRKRFALPVADADEHTRIIVVNVGERTIGIVVDEVDEVLRINSEQIEPPPSSIVGIDHEYIQGIFKSEGRLIILLHIDEILSAEALSALSDAAEKAQAGKKG